MYSSGPPIAILAHPLVGKLSIDRVWERADGQITMSMQKNDKPQLISSRKPRTLDYNCCRSSPSIVTGITCFWLPFKGETMPRKCQQLETEILRRPPKEWLRQERLLQDLRCCREWIHCELSHSRSQSFRMLWTEKGLQKWQRTSVHVVNQLFWQCRAKEN